MAYRKPDGTLVLKRGEQPPPLTDREWQQLSSRRTTREAGPNPDLLAKFLEGIMVTSSEERAAALDRWAERFRQAAEDMRSGREVKFVVSNEEVSTIEDLPLQITGEAELSSFLSSIKSMVSTEAEAVESAGPPSQDQLKRYGRSQYYR